MSVCRSVPGERTLLGSGETKHYIYGFGVKQVKTIALWVGWEWPTSSNPTQKARAWLCRLNVIFINIIYDMNSCPHHINTVETTLKPPHLHHIKPKRKSSKIYETTLWIPNDINIHPVYYLWLQIWNIVFLQECTLPSLNS